jgi:hypothetical protein
MIAAGYDLLMTLLGGEEYLPPPMDAPMAPLQPSTRARMMGLAHGMQPPMTDEEYKRTLEKMRQPWLYGDVPDPHRCAADDDSRGRRSVPGLKCRTVIPDPRELRYCIEHARKLDYPLTPEQLERYTADEARIKLKGLSSKAVTQLERTMDDPDAPAGVRAKAATDVLDRTGFHAKAGLDVQVEAVVIDMAEIIRGRLAAKKAQLQGVLVEQLPEEPPAPELDGA